MLVAKRFRREILFDSRCSANNMKDDSEPPPQLVQLDPKGLPVLPKAPPRTFLDVVKRYIIGYLVIPCLAPVLVGALLLPNNHSRQKLVETIRLVYGIGYVAVGDFQPTLLLSKLWQTRSAQHYVQNVALLWQKREGYCCRATLRCILKSFGCTTAELPLERHGESKPTTFCSHLQELALPQLNLLTEIVSGSVDFDTFVQTLRKVNDDGHCRIAVNYLRSALFGFQFPWFFPTNFLLGIFGGHFSPVVGVLEGEDPRDPLVGVFDVNHQYGGAYLVPASRLYGSVAAVDFFSGSSRAVIVVTSSPS